MISQEVLHRIHELKYKHDNALRTIGATEGMLLAYSRFNPEMPVEINIGLNSVKVSASIVVEILELVKERAKKDVSTLKKQMDSIEN